MTHFFTYKSTTGLGEMKHFFLLGLPELYRGVV